MMSLYLTVEGEIQSVRRFDNDFKSNPKYKFYRKHESLLNRAESRIEYYFDESAQRMKIDNRQPSELSLKTTDGKEITFLFSDLKAFDLGEGNYVVFGTTSDIDQPEAKENDV